MYWQKRFCESFSTKKTYKTTRKLGRKRYTKEETEALMNTRTEESSEGCQPFARDYVTPVKY